MVKIIKNKKYKKQRKMIMHSLSYLRVTNKEKAVYALSIETKKRKKH